MFAWLRTCLPRHRRAVQQRRELELQLEEDLHAVRVLILN